ncbi:MAG TPA: DUF3080 family protein [Marinobacter sp.]|nr:DUF3080 family protein [Marinobacter sp.]
MPVGADVEGADVENKADEGANVWGDLDQAVADHTRGWQQLLDQCGLRPGV